jgi:hypothetical protein
MKQRMRPAVQGSDAVVNTVGHYVERKSATFHAIHGIRPAAQLVWGNGNDAGRDAEQRLNPTIDASRAPNRSAAWPSSTMQAAQATR